MKVGDDGEGARSVAGLPDEVMIRIVARWLARCADDQAVADEVLLGVRSAMGDGRIIVAFLPPSSFGRPDGRLEVRWRGRVIGDIPWSPTGS